MHSSHPPRRDWASASAQRASVAAINGRIDARWNAMGASCTRRQPAINYAVKKGERQPLARSMAYFRQNHDAGASTATICAVLYEAIAEIRAWGRRFVLCVRVAFAKETAAEARANVAQLRADQEGSEEAIEQARLATLVAITAQQDLIDSYDEKLDALRAQKLRRA